MRVDVIMEHWTQGSAAAVKQLATRWLCHPNVTSSIPPTESLWKSQSMSVSVGIAWAVRMTQAQLKMQPIHLCSQFEASLSSPINVEAYTLSQVTKESQYVMLAAASCYILRC